MPCCRSHLDGGRSLSPRVRLAICKGFRAVAGEYRVVAVLEEGLRGNLKENWGIELLQQRFEGSGKIFTVDYCSARDGTGL